MSLRSGLLICFAALTWSCGSALAQGAVGGSLGNDNKSISGSREASRSAAPARRARPEKREAAPRRSRGGGSYAEGAWTVTASGGCAASGTGTILIADGTVSGQGISGSVSSSGAVRTVGNAGGISVIGTGRISGRTASGSYRQSDGCSGTWRGMKN